MVSTVTAVRSPREAFTCRMPQDSRIEPSEWRVFTKTPVNTLIQGESLAVTRVLNAAWLSLRKPVFWCDGPRLTLPSDRTGTFVVWRVDQLPAEDQHRFLDWLGRRDSTRVVTRSAHSLFPLVEQGTFSPELYYRLNTLMIHASEQEAVTRAGDLTPA